MRRRRAQLLWAAVLGFAVVGVSAAWRAGVLWAERALLFELGSTLTPLALAAFAALFSACGTGMVAAAVGLWLWRDWARHLAWAALAGYLAASQAYTWLYVRSGLTWERRWVALGGALLGGLVGVGAMTWPRARTWMGLR